MWKCILLDVELNVLYYSTLKGFHVGSFLRIPTKNVLTELTPKDKDKKDYRCLLTPIEIMEQTLRWTTWRSYTNSNDPGLTVEVVSVYVSGLDHHASKPTHMCVYTTTISDRTGTGFSEEFVHDCLGINLGGTLCQFTTLTLWVHTRTTTCCALLIWLR